MIIFRGLLTAALLGAAASAVAGEPVTGRWGDEASCGAMFFSNNAPLTVSDYAVRWRSESCRIGRVYKTGDTIHIQALCWDLAGERSVPVSLRPHGGKLAVVWDRANRAELKRCP
ncbi:MAG: hypothetical protein WC670_14265 [Pseudolabrys sp.]|jgi:hypothetical protein